MSTGTYEINDVVLDTQPTTGRWLPRDVLGKTGDNRSILPAGREFVMRWQLVDATCVKQVYDAWKAQGATGTSSVNIPELGALPYEFATFSGVFLEEPEVDYYYQEHQANVVLRISGIKIL